MIFQTCQIFQTSTSWNVHRNIFHAPDLAIRPYMTQNRCFCRFWGGWGFCRIWFPIYIYIPYRPCLGSRAGVMVFFQGRPWYFSKPRPSRWGPWWRVKATSTQTSATDTQLRSAALRNIFNKWHVCPSSYKRCSTQGSINMYISIYPYIHISIYP